MFWVLRYGDDRGTKWALMHNKNGFYEAGSVLDEAPDHENAVELLENSKGDGSKKSMKTGFGGGTK